MPVAKEIYFCASKQDKHTKGDVEFDVINQNKHQKSRYNWFDMFRPCCKYRSKESRAYYCIVNEMFGISMFVVESNVKKC